MVYEITSYYNVSVNCQCLITFMHSCKVMVLRSVKIRLCPIRNRLLICLLICVVIMNICGTYSVYLYKWIFLV